MTNGRASCQSRPELVGCGRRERGRSEPRPGPAAAAAAAAAGREPGRVERRRLRARARRSCALAAAQARAAPPRLRPPPPPPLPLGGRAGAGRPSWAGRAGVAAAARGVEAAMRERGRGRLPRRLLLLLALCVQVSRGARTGRTGRSLGAGRHRLWAPRLGSPGAARGGARCGGGGAPLADPGPRLPRSPCLIFRRRGPWAISSCG